VTRAHLRRGEWVSYDDSSNIVLQGRGDTAFTSVVPESLGEGIVEELCPTK
jgi:hypothetical protein